MSGSEPMVNPYRKRAPPLVQNVEIMGRQSQQRVSNQHKRAFKLAGPTRTKKRRKGDQLTLEGALAFDPVRDCPICKAHDIRRFNPEYRVPKRAHHIYCSKNKRTFGQGELSTATEASLKDDARYKALISPIRPEERGHGKFLTAETAAAFFSPKISLKNKQEQQQDIREEFF